MRKDISVVLKHQCVVLCYHTSRKLTQILVPKSKMLLVTTKNIEVVLELGIRQRLEEY